MIVIVSEHGDESTNWVIDWISYYKEKFIRINRDDLLDSNKTNLKVEIDSSYDDIRVKINDEINRDEIKSIWFRRSVYPYLSNDILPELQENVEFSDVKKNFYYEYFNSSLFLYACLEKNKKKLGNFRQWRLNKLEVLTLAKESGILVPDTIVTNKKSDVEEFIRDKKSIITKAISEVFDIRVKKGNEIEVFINYTEEITKEILERLPQAFFYSLFQEKLDKDIEIRTFYLDGECYSMAIFSQLDQQTSVDFRKYSNNRNVPYQLPAELEAKIRKLMLALELNTGSIDFVKTKDGRFVFLEINPTGQYGMTSNPCNYHLHKKIANYLIKYEL